MTAVRRTRLSVTRLESRENPSTMTYAPGSFFGNSGDVNLFVQFTGTNAISWTTSPPTTPAAFAAGTSTLGGNLSITLLGCGTNTAGTPGNTGNTVTVDLNGNTLTGNLTIVTGNCDDAVAVLNGTVNGLVSIKTNGGDDHVFLGGNSVAGGPPALAIGTNLLVSQGAGADSMFLGGSLGVGGNASINMGAGNNFYSLASQFAIGGNLNIAAGAGNDPINQLGVAGSTIGGKATFTPGGGTNSLILPTGLSIAGNVGYSGGAGADSVFDDATIGGNLICIMAGGSDRFTYGLTPFVGGNAKLFGGPPLTDVYTQLSIPTWPNSVIGFP